MAEQFTREQIAQAATIHELPPVTITNPPVDRTFGLPTGLYAATVGLFLAYIAVMGVGFAHPEMAIPVVIFALFVIAGFGVPAIWTRLNPQTQSKALTWARFRQEGIMTAYGRTTGRDATVQVLILPVLIFLWGVITVTIAALV
ncbi:hypothetical protein [Aurantiacibacter sediminis]|uniref:Uncharacterized protein n=1 Tax=Aurantiacibacter sediminis TaxID=2793064 RepID=A0ABS0N301_9SPHN|nr:hypothetical protein [Aurantiacibacter sediminis]MBH5322092.1 hypothetical protein [Aurantiacibacter sediminis]